MSSMVTSFSSYRWSAGGRALIPKNDLGAGCACWTFKIGHSRYTEAPMHPDSGLPLCPSHHSRMIPSEVGIRYVHLDGAVQDRWYFRCADDLCHLKHSRHIGYFFVDIDPSQENPDGSPRLRIQRIGKFSRLCPYNPPAHLFVSSVDLAKNEWIWACPKDSCTCSLGRQPDKIPDFR